MKSSLTGILFLCLLMFVATPFLSATEKAAEGLSWETDISVAMEKAKKEGKDILINFTGSDWCGWCKKLDGEVFAWRSAHLSGSSNPT